MMTHCPCSPSAAAAFPYTATQRRERETGVSSVAREGGAFKGRRESETARVHHSLERASMPGHVKADAFD